VKEGEIEKKERLRRGKTQSEGMTEIKRKADGKKDTPRKKERSRQVGRLRTGKVLLYDSS